MSRYPYGYCGMPCALCTRYRTAGDSRCPGCSCDGYYTVPLGKADIKRPGKDVTLVMKGSAVLTGITINLKQWASKTQTAMLYTSTNGGASYSSNPVAESGNFTLSANSLPEGTNAVKLSFSSENQVGIASFDITYKE